MHPATSRFLDAIRFSAACIVLLSHLTSREFNHAFPWINLGHEAVVVFFVMSGFVIAYVAKTRENSGSEYIAARLGRLYSVVLPAIILTAVLDFLGRKIDPAWYSTIPVDRPIVRLLVNFFFVQQVWNFTVLPLSNGPFWSLSFEFWYYVIFGAWYFLKGRTRILVVSVLCLLVGPRILAFFPLWLLGVYAYMSYAKLKLSMRTQQLLFWFACIAFSGVLILGNPLKAIRTYLITAQPDGYFHIAGINIFKGDIYRLPEDFLLALLITSIIIFSRALEPLIDAKSRFSQTIKYLAGTTFTIYLFHAPILYFLAATVGLNISSPLQVMSLGATTLFLCIMSAYLGERRVYGYRRFFSSLTRTPQFSRL